MVILMSANVQSQSYNPTPENLKSREWFRNARFGMFIHWGVYSVLGDGEWVMHERKIHIDDYEKLPSFFDPVDFNAQEWVSLAKAAGMKYITVTTRHHDGFAMFNTKASDWNIVDRTRYKKDIIKQLADECHKQGIKIFFYYSHLDWHHPDYFPRGNTARELGRPEKGDWPKYIDFINAQLRELLTNYGEVGGIWFDGWWDRPDADWQLDRTYKLIHELQPAALVGNNHHKDPFPGEDFQMWERDLPGHNAAGFGTGQGVAQHLPLETCDTMNGSWGFRITDRNYKSPRQIVQYLARAAVMDANLLMNVGPMPNGKIQPEFVERLQETGKWMKANGESIYGTRGGPVTPQPWGVTTQREDTVYVHLFDEKLPAEVLLPDLGEKQISASVLGSGEKVDTATSGTGLLLKTTDLKPDACDTVVVLKPR